MTSMVIHWGYETLPQAYDRAARCTPGWGNRIVVRKRNGKWGVYRDGARTAVVKEASA